MSEDTHDNENGQSERRRIMTFLREFDARQSNSAASFMALQDRTWRGLAGDHYDRMLANPESAREYLSHREADLRLAALSILTDHFGLWEEMRADYERMADADLDPAVRTSAKLSLVNYYQRRKDRRAKRLLARMIRDESETDDTRLNCYVMLIMSIHDMPLSKQPENLESDVDWRLVDEILKAPA